MSRPIALLLLYWFGAAPCHAQLYEMPFKAEDLDQGGVRIYWGRAEHASSGVQKFGYDLGALRYDSKAKKWTELTVSDADYNKNRTNNKWVIYGRNIYAARPGRIIACWRNAPENPPGGRHPKIDEGFIYGGGNGYWIEHEDGTRMEYAHMIPGSVPGNLCPHNDTFMPSRVDSPDVTKAWPHIRVPAAQQKTVVAGQFLGRVGNAGTSSAPHLHIHVEEGGKADTVKSGGTPVNTNFKRGLAAPLDHTTSTPAWKSFRNQPIPPGPAIIWPARTLTTEYAQHGHAAADFQPLFDHLADSGYWPVWLDAYGVGGHSFINHVWRPAKGAWRAHSLVSSATHQANIDDAIKDGFAPVFVDSSTSGGQLRYSAIFTRDVPRTFIMRHGLSSAQADAELNNARQAKLNPVNISVASVGGSRSYTLLYRPESIGTWQIKSQMPEKDYQGVFNDNAKQGRKPIYVNAYMHGGQPYITAVFASRAVSLRKDRHNMSAAQYQNEWQSAINSGALTRAVTSFDGATSTHRFAASWWK